MTKKRVFLSGSIDGVTYGELGSTDDLKNTERFSPDRHVEVRVEGDPPRFLSSVALMAVGAEHLVAQRDRSVDGNRTKRDRAEGRQRRVSELAKEHRADHKHNPKSRLGSTRGMAREVTCQLSQHGEFKNAETKQAWSERTILSDLAVLGIK